MVRDAVQERKSAGEGQFDKQLKAEHNNLGGKQSGSSQTRKCNASPSLIPITSSKIRILEKIEVHPMKKPWASV